MAMTLIIQAVGMQIVVRFFSCLLLERDIHILTPFRNL